MSRAEGILEVARRLGPAKLLASNSLIFTSCTHLQESRGEIVDINGLQAGKRRQPPNETREAQLVEVASLNAEGAQWEAREGLLVKQLDEGTNGLQVAKLD